MKANRKARAGLRKALLGLTGGDDAELSEPLARLDADGFLLGPGETVAAARERGLRLCDRLDVLDDEIAARGGAEVDGGALVLKAGDRIAAGLMTEAGATTEALYGFRLEWAPGFYLTVGRWKLWGGCAWGDEREGIAVFLLRREFRDRARYGIYDRLEILSHELCHLARWPFGADGRLEEFHAYRTSKQPLRRYLGNCFSSPWDAPIFVAPAMTMAAAQAARVALDGSWPMWPFWLATAAGPAWLLVKNHFARRRYFKALATLRRIGVERPAAVLFRSVWEELPDLAAVPDRDALRKYAREHPDPRWRVVAGRFL